MVSLFVKPLFEAMNDQNKGVQAGSAMCMAMLVEGSVDPPVAAFQKLCPRICKFLNNPNFHAKAALLAVVSSLSQAQAIVPHSLESLLHCIHDCLGSSDWATRKAAADTLSALALNSRNIITDGAASTMTVLESCRFDKIKPVRDSISEALQLWKKIAGNAGSSPEDRKTLSHKFENSESIVPDKSNSQNTNPNDTKGEPSVIESSNRFSPTCDSVPKVKGRNMSEKAVGILKKRAPALTDKELNAEFFQKLETRGSGEFPVEVIVPRRHPNSSSSHDEEEIGQDDTNTRGGSNRVGNCQPDDDHGSVSIKRGTAGVLSKQRNFNEFARGKWAEDGGTTGVLSKQRNFDEFARDKWAEDGVTGKHLETNTFDVDDKTDFSQREISGIHAGFSKTEGQSDGSFMSNRGNWAAIQRQLLQLERQQTHLVNMLQDFMGGSHDSMVTLENRVRGLERVVEDMARDLSISSGRRGSNFMVGCDEPSNRPLSKYSGYADYYVPKFGRGGDGRVSFGERFNLSDGVSLGSIRGRAPSWRSEMSQAWDSHSNGASKNGQTGSRRGLNGNPMDDRLTKSELDSDLAGSRRAWDKGMGAVRLGEGPSARSVWQASKDEATLEAIRVAGEDNGKVRTPRVAIPELTAESMADDNVVQERDPIWTSWSNAMDALHVGDTDSAYAEVLSAGDDLLLVKLMDRSGPVVDQLSNEIACEILHAVAQLLLDQNLLDMCLLWIQQLIDLVMENGPNTFGIPIVLKREILFNLHEASSTLDPPEDWEGASPEQLMLQLASAWDINLQQQLGK